jgi:hypothetical protein
MGTLLELAEGTFRFSYEMDAGTIRVQGPGLPQGFKMDDFFPVRFLETPNNNSGGVSFLFEGPQVGKGGVGAGWMALEKLVAKLAGSYDTANRLSPLQVTGLFFEVQETFDIPFNYNWTGLRSKVLGKVESFGKEALKNGILLGEDALGTLANLRIPAEADQIWALETCRKFKRLHLLNRKT